MERLRPFPLPSVAPDTTPTWFHDDSSWTTEGSLRQLKQVISVAFREGTSQADRQHAIDMIGGRVVGGWLFSPKREGVYAVELRGNKDKHRQHAIDRLRKLPYVKMAVPVF